MIQQIHEDSSSQLSQPHNNDRNMMFRTFECPHCGRKSVHLIIRTHPMRIRCGGRDCGIILAQLPAQPQQL
jgi:hypothetical protein